MLTVHKCLPQGLGLSAVLIRRATRVELDWDVRQKSRFDATDSSGRHLGVFLPRGTVVRGGDVLVAEDGSLVHVVAAPQAVLVVEPCAEHGSPFDLVRAAYHLGNRHVALQLTPERLLLEPDHVLAEMLEMMHLTVRSTQAPFEPESGAYTPGAHGHAHAAGHAHGQGQHDHGHTHDHGLDHAQATAHDGAPASRGKPVGVAVKAAPMPHVHGPGCGHDH